MRRKNKKTAGVFLLAVILVFIFILAFSVDAAEKKGSVTVELNEIGTDRMGIVLECLFVAEEGENGWHLTESFDGSGVKPWKLEKSADYRKTAEKLSSWAKNRNLSVETETTDKNGELVFSDLKEGIYLICQKSGFRTYGTIAPFLVRIPMKENGRILYDVHTKTKGEETPKITATPIVTPSASVTSSGSFGSRTAVKSGSSNVKTVRTGDDTAIAVFWVLLILAAGGTVGILYYRKKH